MHIMAMQPSSLSALDGFAALANAGRFCEHAAICVCMRAGAGAIELEDSFSFVKQINDVCMWQLSLACALRQQPESFTPPGGFHRRSGMTRARGKVHIYQRDGIATVVFDHCQWLQQRLMNYVRMLQISH